MVTYELLQLIDLIYLSLFLDRKNNIGDGYIKDLAREVLQYLPEFSDPEHEAHC